MITVALFNNKGGVGKTTLAYHLAHMMSRLGARVLAVDLDPQANLTAHFVDEDRLEGLWLRNPEEPTTVAHALDPIVEGLGDVARISPWQAADRLWLLPGDLDLSRFEERLAASWPSTLAGTDNAAIRVTTAFHRMIRQTGAETSADVALIDVGPNLGALNRSALLAADCIMVPLGADLFSAQGLRNLGPALRRWRTDWQATVRPRIPATIDAPAGSMRPIGYVVMQPSMRLDRPVKAYRTWLDRMPEIYATNVLELPVAEMRQDEIGTVRNYRSLMPLAHDARKPMFDLRAADGAIGSTQRFVQTCLLEFRELASEVLKRLDVAVST